MLSYLLIHLGNKMNEKYNDEDFDDAILEEKDSASENESSTKLPSEPDGSKQVEKRSLAQKMTAITDHKKILLIIALVLIISGALFFLFGNSNSVAFDEFSEAPSAADMQSKVRGEFTEQEPDPFSDEQLKLMKELFASTQIENQAANQKALAGMANMLKQLQSDQEAIARKVAEDKGIPADDLNKILARINGLSEMFESSLQSLEKDVSAQAEATEKNSKNIGWLINRVSKLEKSGVKPSGNKAARQSGAIKIKTSKMWVVRGGSSASQMAFIKNKFNSNTLRVVPGSFVPNFGKVTEVKVVNGSFVVVTTSGLIKEG